MNPNHITKRTNKAVSPLMDRNITPDTHKFNIKENLDTVNDSYLHAPSMKEFSQNSPLSTDYGGRKRSHTNFVGNQENQLTNPGRTLAEINLDLDNNMNEVIYLLGRRRNLISLKKRKIKEERYERMDSTPSSTKHQNGEHSAHTLSATISQMELQNDAQFLKISSFCENPKTAVNILGKMIQSLPETLNNDKDNAKSEYFWERNKKLENIIDFKLADLKQVDKTLQKTNSEVLEICKKLDMIQESLKTIVGSKASDNMQKVEPLFAAKNSNYDLLNVKVKEREVVKDAKLQYVKDIREALNQLKDLREDRIRQIQRIFGPQIFYQFKNLNANNQKDLTNAFEELLKIKEKDSFLETNERDAWVELENNSKELDSLCSEILRKQSDQAKAFHNYSKIMNQRVKYFSILRTFGLQEAWTASTDFGGMLRKFGRCKDNMRKSLDEDRLIHEGIYKTDETMRTFNNILRAIQSEKERRHELLGLLETCLHRRTQYQHKKEQLRNIMVDETKNQQQKTHYEEELEIILSDGDINSYKQIGSHLTRCEKERVRLAEFKLKIDRELEEMDNEAVKLATHIQDNYEDILCQIIPSDYQYSLRNGQDVKKIRNFIRKMYKRLGILKNQEGNKSKQ